MKYLMTLCIVCALFACQHNKTKSSIQTVDAENKNEVSITEESVIGEKSDLEQVVSTKDKTIESTPPPPPPPFKNKPISTDAPTSIASKIIKNALINMEVSDYKKDKQKIIDIVKKQQGYISSENESNTEYALQNILVIKIPAQNFEGASSEIENIAKKIDSKNVSAEDVTAQYVDQAARLKTKREVMNRYIDILKKANRIDDILAVESELRIIQEEIECTEAQLKEMDDQVAFSTLTLTIYKQTGFVTSKKSFFSEIGDSIANGWNSLLNGIIGLVGIWPFLLFLTLIGFVVRFFVKRYNNRSTQKK